MKPFDGASPSSMGQESVYAELYEDTAGGTVITVTTAATYYGWTTGNKGLVSGRMFQDTANATADRLQVQGQGKGVYRLSAVVTAKGVNNGLTNMAVHKNSALQTNLKAYVEFGAAAVATTYTVQGLIELSDGEYIDLRFTSNTNADTITLYTANLTLVRIS